jgi:hypothetical protein
MKYFTPDLLTRINSLDEEVMDAADEEWERAIKRYRRRITQIKEALPAGVQHFRRNHVCLHDARLLSIGREGETFSMVLQPEPPAQTLVELTFTLEREPVIDRQAVPGHRESDWVEWMYEEWDIDRQKRCWFEVLLSNGWSVKLCFRDFHYRIAQRLFPVPKPPAGVTAPSPQTPLPQTA